MSKISSSQFLIQLLKNRLATANWVNAELAAVSELAFLHQISPYVFCLVQSRNILIPLELYSELKHCYLSNLARNLEFWKEFLTINDVFTASGIPLVPLKGMDILVRFYPSFETRNMVDIDILVKNECYDKAALTLEKLGYEKVLGGLKEQYWRNKHCHVKFCKDWISVDLHWELDCKRSTPPLLPHLWERTQQINIPNHTLRVLSSEDAFISLALHLRRFGYILSLKQILDAAHLISANRDFSWSYIFDECVRCNMQATVFFLLTQVSLYTDAHIPKGFLQKLRLPLWQKMAIRNFIVKQTFKMNPPLKLNYLKAHFLLYDNILEPARYIITIPYEQFCRFYELAAYTKKSRIFYALRFVYMPLKFFLSYILKIK